MSDLIPRKSWTLAFEEMEDVVFHLKEVTDQEYLEAVDIAEDFYNPEATRRKIEECKLKLYDYFFISVDGLQEISIKLKLNIAVQILKYLNPDVLEVKK